MCSYYLQYYEMSYGLNVEMHRQVWYWVTCLISLHQNTVIRSVPPSALLLITEILLFHGFLKNYVEIRVRKVPELFPNRKVRTVRTEQLCPGQKQWSALLPSPRPPLPKVFTWFWRQRSDFQLNSATFINLNICGHIVKIFFWRLFCVPSPAAAVSSVSYGTGESVR